MDVPAPPEGDNPYAAPATSTVASEEFLPIPVPAGFWPKFVLAIRLYFVSFVPLASLILTFWLPANLFITSATFGNPADENGMLSFRLNSMAESVIGPPVAAAVIALIAARLEGRRVGYRSALGVGLRSWWPVFAADFVAGLFILLGLVALIVPGLILMVRYSLMNQAVVLERAGVSESRSRSTELVKGRGWQIVMAWLLSCLVYVGVTTLNIAFLTIAPDDWDGQISSVVFSCLQDVGGLFLTVWLTLYFWEARSTPKPSPDPEFRMSPVA
jgi:hypothetical protein